MKFKKSLTRVIPTVKVSKNTAKIMLGVALSVCCVALGQVSDAQNATGTLGVCNIANPTTGQIAATNTYNYVYFGNIPNDTTNYASSVVNKPILWRVLNTTANDDAGTPALFMLTEYGISQKAWDENNNGSNETAGQIWDDYYATVEGYNEDYGVDRASTVRGFLQGITSGKPSGKSYAKADYNGNGMYQNCFSDKERAAIMTTVKMNSEKMEVANDSSNPSSLINPSGSTKRKWRDGYYAYGCPLRGDTIFLLSAEEASNSSYGFQQPTNTETAPVADNNRICKLNDASSWWWLRSAYSNTYRHVADVDTDGTGIYHYGSTPSGAVRSALNIHLSSVICTSASNAGSSIMTSIPATAPSAPAISSAGLPSGKTEADIASKLTILDTTRSNFQITESTKTALKGETITLNYTGSTTGTGEHISAIIKNSSSSGTHYQGRCKENVSSSSGTVNITLPSNIANGTYTLMVYNETESGTTKTNYARYDNVTLTVGVLPPSVTSVHANIAKTAFKVVATDYVGITKITDQNGNNAKTISGSPTSLKTTYTTSSGITGIRVYNSSTYTPVSSFTTDSVTPSAAATYSQGTYTITASDSSAGIWKITNPSGTILSATTWNSNGGNYEGTYPSSATYKANGPITIANAVVYDGVNNTKTVSLDTAAPSVSGYYNSSKVKLVAQDGTAGLWKISTDSAGSTIVKSYSGQTTKQIDVVTTYAPTVYGFDRAGNKTAQISLVQDTAAPTATVSYNNGNITINVTDSGSGIAQVGSNTTSYTSYPTSASNVAVTTGTSSVTLKDALGNTGSVNIDATGPQASGFYNGSKIKITARDTGSGLWKVTQTNDKTAADIGNSTFTKNNSWQTRIISSSLSTVYVFDHAGNGTKVDLVQDTAAPTAVPTYNNGNITINVTDGGSGIAQVGSNTTSYTSYPTSASNVAVTTGTSSVTLKDAVGNSRNVTIDATGPEASGFYNGSKIKITARDTGSGLWKVTQTNDKTAADIGNSTFTKNNSWQTRIISSSLSTVYVFDHAGNGTKVDLVQDTAAPTAVPTYNNGNITINVTDGGSGIAQVGSNTTSYTSYPTSASNVAVTTGTSSVTLKDAVGNSRNVTIDATGPEASGFYNGSKIKITARDTGSGLWKVTQTNDKTAADIGNSTFTKNNSWQTRIISSSLSTVYVFDHAGNGTKVDLVQDTAAPTAVPTYNNGNITINVTDGGSGIAQVGSNTTSYTSYPTSASNVAVTTGTSSVTLKDAVGNSRNVTIDATGPEASGFYNGSKIKITARDTGSGLWKVTQTNDKTAADIGNSTFTKNTSWQTRIISSSLSTVYVFDHAGNGTKVDLVQDTAAPTAVPTYNNGNITINVTDSGSGIAQVGSDTTSYTSYPASASNVAVTTGTSSVTLKDALGNTGSVNIDATGPEASGFYNGSKIKITARDTGSGLWKVTQTNDKTAADIGNSTFTKNTSWQTRIISSSLSTVYVFDHAGNGTKVDLVQDTTAPTAVPTYNNGNITINVTDGGSGIEQVGSDTTSYTSYPTSASNVAVTTGTSSVTLKDAVGNSRNVTIDATGPEASGFYNNGKIKVTAQDGASGLWKITATNDLAAPDIENSAFVKNTNQQTRVITSNLTTVYVFDHAGNSQEVNLVHDGTGPDVDVSYSEGTYIITATDLGDIIEEGQPERREASGLSRITTVVNNEEVILPGHDTQVQADYSATYPTTGVTYVGIGPVQSITAYDVFDNQTEVSLDYTKPEASGFYGNGNVKVTARDTGSGLWKVTATNDKTVADIGNSTFTKNNEWQTRVISSNLSTVYVFDHAGNGEQVDLVQDTAAPTIATSYNAGIITLTVSDPVGIARIDSTPYTDYATSKSITISPEKNSVYVEDALGNSATLEIDTTAPQITKAFKKGTTAIVGAIAQGIDLCKVSESNDFTNTDTDTPFTNTQQEILQVTLSDENITTLYVYDVAGHRATVTLVEDTEAPTATPTYNQGTITINVGDTSDGTATGVGLARVGSDTQSYTAYPTQATAQVTTGTASVELEDALGNQGSVAIDNTAPTGIAGYYNGTTGVLTVADEQGGSGLWKIAKPDGTELLGVTQGNRRTFTIDPEDITQDANNNNVVYVKVYDQAGNTQDQAIVLEEDNEGPEVSVTYSGGKYYITASDNAGIWRVTDTTGNIILANYGEPGRAIPQE